MQKADFAAACGLSIALADKWYDPVERALMEFAIASPQRAAMFLATIGHESADFRYTREIWGPTPTQERYEMRVDLGNVKPGDGKRFMGRGLIQITGRANYAAVSRGLGVDYQSRPEDLERPPDAARASGWWWQNNGCNEIADRGDFLRLSIRVNGKNRDGLPNGWADRQRRYKAAMAVLG